MNNIRELRAAKGWSTRELAERMATHYTTIARIERSTKPLDSAWTKRFAAALEIDAHEIKNGTVATFGQEVRVLPIIGMVAAGSWREAIQQAGDTLPSPYGGPNAFALVVDGDSMNKITPNGSHVIVDPDQSSLHDGGYYVVMNADGETTFKQYRSDPARLEPMSDDESHQTILLGRSPFEVVGQVLGIFRPM